MARDTTSPNRRPPSGQHSGKPRKQRHDRVAIIQRAVGSLATALMAQGYAPADATRFSRLLLTRPGVTITKGGVRYHGSRYTPEQFAQGRLAHWITGKQAERLNDAALRSNPVYQQEMAQLQRQRDDVIAGNVEQRNRALLDFGDSALVQKDPLLAAQAAANPFSTSRLIQRQYEQNQLAATQAASRAGTYSGGGEVSGQQEATRQHAATSQDAYTQMQDLLTGLSKSDVAARQAVTGGESQALQDAYQNLLQTGGQHAVRAPTAAELAAGVRPPWTQRPPQPTAVGFHVAGMPQALTAAQLANVKARYAALPDQRQQAVSFHDFRRHWRQRHGLGVF